MDRKKIWSSVFPAVFPPFDVMFKFEKIIFRDTLKNLLKYVRAVLHVLENKYFDPPLFFKLNGLSQT